ncbi:unnamed protein product [Schistosoma curassoni]|uniref:Uncharacterized protein n=1 Tax=Schistosoma curassoni TaxID=6186 RepID=A0A183JH36_9TREM|nr:unnamed protein product [Schistosoma curassoni]
MYYVSSTKPKAFDCATSFLIIMLLTLNFNNYLKDFI